MVDVEDSQTFEKWVTSSRCRNGLVGEVRQPRDGAAEERRDREG